MYAMRNKKSNKTTYYFTKDTDNNIFQFLYGENYTKDERDKIYRENIKPAFNKLVENLIFILGVTNIDTEYETLKHDCTVHLYEKLPMFEFERGKKAFSYFNIVAKNYLLLQAKQSTRRSKYNVLYNDRNSTEEMKGYNLLQEIIEPHESEVIQREYFMLLTEEISKWKEKTKNQKEQIVLEAIYQLFKNIESINIYDKKAIFIYLKEITNMTTKQLCVNINKIRTRYHRFKKRYYRELA